VTAFTTISPFALFLVCLVGPSLALAPRIRAEPLEALVVAIGVSLVLLYAATFAIYQLGCPDAGYVVVGLCAAAGGAGISASRPVIVDPDLRRAAGALAIVVGVGLLELSTIRNFAGGGWAGDWLEHYQRAMFLLERASLRTKFLDARYILPARPPLMNLLTALFLSQTPQSFPAYQLVSLLLNSLVVLPVVLLARHFSAGQTPRVAVLAAFLLLNPSFNENLTYGWTRHLTNFWVLAGLYAYARARDTDSPATYLVAFSALSAGVVTHYSAAPYFVLCTAHAVIFVLPRKALAVRDVLVIAGVCAGVIGSWVLWSIFTYGLGDTFGANTTVTGSHGASTSDLAIRFAANLRNTLVPHPLRTVNLAWIAQRDPLGFFKDSCFLIYQTNLIVAVGSAGALLVAYETSRREHPACSFWAGIAIATVLLGIAVDTNLDDFGVAHACLQPLVLLALAFLAGGFASWPRWAQLLAGCGLAVDFLLGVALLLWFEHQVPTAQPLGWWSDGTYGNWRVKQQAGVTFLGDLMEPWVGVAAASLAVAVIALWSRAEFRFSFFSVRRRCA
jgi:hypothetical protein